MAGILFGPALAWDAQIKRARPFCDQHPDAFQWPAHAAAFLRYIFADAGGHWAFRPNGKTGTTSTFYFLFHLMFGTPLTARMIDPDGQNEDQAGHQLADARVFAKLIEHPQGGDPQAFLDKALRFTTVRHPMQRALSGFDYLATSQQAQRSKFFSTRARMNALVGFDWEHHPGTPDGFERFLDYLQQEITAVGPVEGPGRPIPDSHFRPQVWNIRPAVFKPDLIGRCEDLPTFFRDIAARLDRPIPPGALDAPPRNPGSGQSDRTALITDRTRQLVAEIFAEDFEAFGYDP